MKNPLSKLRQKILLLFLKIPIFNKYSNHWYSGLGVKGSGYRISSKITVVGEYANLKLGKQSEINTGCFLLAKDEIIIGENSTLAYQVTILTSANPNGPHNKLVKLYPKMSNPVSIGNNTWIGARATILPGITVGDCCVVAAGAVVTKNVPDYTVVGGLPAKEIKKLNPSDFD